jgi:hypothetical protein
MQYSRKRTLHEVLQKEKELCTKVSYTPSSHEAPAADGENNIEDEECILA